MYTLIKGPPVSVKVDRRPGNDDSKKVGGCEEWTFVAFHLSQEGLASRWKVSLFVTQVKCNHKAPVFQPHQ